MAYAYAWFFIKRWGELKMEYRKVIKFGNSSHVISLPKAWTDTQNIKKGDVIYFEENEKGNLTISPRDLDERDSRQIVKLNVDGISIKKIQLEMIAAYIKEFSKLIFTGKEISKKSKELRRMLRELMGVEVIEQTKTKMVAKDFLNIKEIKLEDIRRRLDSVVRNMIIDSKIGEGKSNYQDVINRDYDANKFSYVSLRVIRRGMEKPKVRKQTGLSLLELSHEQHIILAMERIGDIAKWISREDCYSKLSKSEIAELNKLHEIVLENYITAMKAYNKKDYGTCCNIVSKNKEIQMKCDNSKNKLKSLSAFKITHLIREMSNDINILGEVGFMNCKSNIIKVYNEEDLPEENL